MTSFSVLIDTREKDLHILNELSARGIPFKRRKLNVGDYSFEWKGVSYENKIVIERKGSINEIVGNFTKGRKRFENEFKRAKGVNVHLMIEADRNDIKNHKYRSTMTPSEVNSFINTWCYVFQLKLKFIEKDKATDYILQTFRDYLLKGD